jgi:hypothetical protein
METDMDKLELVMQSNSNKILSIMQPTYLPWLGYFNLIKTSDIFVIYDTVQLTKRSWQVRNRIKSKDGEMYLTIPIKKTSDRDSTKIIDAEIDYSKDWQKNHLNAIFHSYKKSKYFDEVYPIVESHLSKKHKNLSNLTSSFIIDMCDLFGIKTEILFSSEIHYQGKKSESLISICNFFKTNKYKSVKGSMDYILNDKNLFIENNIDLIWHEYTHPVYNQMYGDFLSHMSIIDCMFNVGVNKTSEMI